MAPRPATRSRRPPDASTDPIPPIQHAQTGDDGEHFDLNVSGSDIDEESAQRQPRGHRTATTSTVPIEPVDQQINDPAVREKKTTAHDIKYFFESHGDEHVVCKECK